MSALQCVSAGNVVRDTRVLRVARASRSGDDARFEEAARRLRLQTAE